MMNIRPLMKSDRDAVVSIVRRTDVFSEGEVDVAAELLDAVLNEPAQKDYIIYVSSMDERVTGYFCVGQTPLTDGTYDLYWIAVDPDHQGRKIGRRLLEAAEELVRSSGGRLIVAETSSTEKYRATRLFYEHTGYREVARIRDYYRSGDDLMIYGKYL